MIPTQCVFCKHFDQESSEPVRCAAFPEGIPDDIWHGAIEHDRPRPDLGQKNTLVREQAEGAPF